MRVINLTPKSFILNSGTMDQRGGRRQRRCEAGTSPHYKRPKPRRPAIRPPLSRNCQTLFGNVISFKSSIHTHTRPSYFCISASHVIYVRRIFLLSMYKEIQVAVAQSPADLNSPFTKTRSTLYPASKPRTTRAPA